MRDRAFDRFDDVGEADLGAAGRAQSRRPRRARSRAGRQAASRPISFWAVGSGTPVSLDSSVALRRAPVRPAGGRGHHHDRIIGKVAQAHVNSELSSPI